MTTTQAFGVCIMSEDGTTGAANSFMVAFNSVVGDTYTFTQTDYNSTTCTNSQQTQTYVFTTGECNTEMGTNGDMFSSVTSDYSPTSGSYNNMINYASAATCSVGDYTNVTSAISFPSSTCFHINDTAVSFYYGCNSFKYYFSADCSGDVYDGSFAGSFTGCSLVSDDDDYDDVSYNAIEDRPWSCNDGGNDGEKDRLAGWVVAVIVISILLGLCCLGGERTRQSQAPSSTPPFDEHRARAQQRERNTDGHIVDGYGSRIYQYQ
jgi:hypothetical protein